MPRAKSVRSHWQTTFPALDADASLEDSLDIISNERARRLNDDAQE